MAPRERAAADQAALGEIMRLLPCWVPLPEEANTAEDWELVHLALQLRHMYAPVILLDDDMLLLKHGRQLQILCESIRDRVFRRRRRGQHVAAATRLRR